nr:MAG TPA: hypothetical protein [Caudoviricetes sp.]
MYSTPYGSNILPFVSRQPFFIKTFESFFICPPVIPGIIKPVAAKPILI